MQLWYDNVYADFAMSYRWLHQVDACCAYHLGLCSIAEEKHRFHIHKDASALDCIHDCRLPQIVVTICSRAEVKGAVPCVGRLLSSTVHMLHPAEIIVPSINIQTGTSGTSLGTL